jgi:hypothetical protein
MFNSLAFCCIIYPHTFFATEHLCKKILSFCTKTYKNKKNSGFLFVKNCFYVFSAKICHTGIGLKGHGNEAGFLGFLQKLVPPRSLTLPLDPFRFCLRIRRDIHNRKNDARLADSDSRLLNA